MITLPLSLLPLELQYPDPRRTIPGLSSTSLFSLSKAVYPSMAIYGRGNNLNRSSSYIAIVDFLGPRYRKVSTVSFLTAHFFLVALSNAARTLFWVTVNELM